MSAKLLDGKKLASLIQQELTEKIQKFSAQTAIGLAVILVGNDPASKIYVQHKQSACKKIGIQSFLYDLPENTSEQELYQLIETLNHDQRVHGILLQLPLPKHLAAENFLEKIDYRKDVDGFHPYNFGRLALRRPYLRPCTPLGIMRLLEYYQIPLRGKNATIIGASNIVGRPLALEFLLASATITVCHKFTKDLTSHICQADILVSATGKRDIFPCEWIKPGAIVIDVGIHRLTNGDVVGDINFNEASERASYITPVPGGVGPMTVAMLLENTVKAWENLK